LAQNQNIEEVIVTGTYIRRLSQFDSPSPLLSVTSDDLAANGANEIGRVLEDLTINTGSQNNSGPSRSPASPSCFVFAAAPCNPLASSRTKARPPMIPPSDQCRIRRSRL
jgi:hypothetical protein